jgi:hypothetical protein
MDTKETVSKKDYDELVEAYGECQARYQREVAGIRRHILQAYEYIRDDAWTYEDLPQEVVEALCQIKVAAIKIHAHTSPD